MKTKQIFFKFFLVTALLFPAFSQGVVFAPKSATLPENRPLQPIPEFVGPNLEHSVNTPPEGQNAQISGEQNEANPAPEVGPGQEEKSPAGNPFLIWGVLGLVAVFVLLAVAIRKGGEDKK
ncbi:MAG: hypothetical protein M1333_02730 [Patescibacteria group bacterium]|nr:hypothetical protein [Patescibacteria group bacterium]